MGLFSSTCSDLGLKGRQVKPNTTQRSSCCDTREDVPSPGSKEISEDCRPCGFSTLTTKSNSYPLLNKRVALLGTGAGGLCRNLIHLTLIQAKRSQARKLGNRQFKGDL